MCGLAGFVDPTRSDQARQEYLRRATSTLVHRGPDDVGYWNSESPPVGLGFRRLAIMDLSPAGAQPMKSHSGRYVLVFNGEVYNFEALRAELGDGVAYRGHSDTEVMLEAIDRWGVEAATKRFQGMFAFAVWDTRDRELWLGRDRVGIKPLYVARGRKWMVFASELRAVLDHPLVEPTGNVEAAWHYLRELYVPAPMSMIQGVEKVRPGTLVRVRVGPDGVIDEEIIQYWSLRDVAERPALHVGSKEETLERFEQLLTESVRSRMVADVPVGCLLSGGVDSTLVVAIMAQLSERRPRTFTIRFSDHAFDEGPAARLVATTLGTDHTEVAFSEAEVLALVPDLAASLDEPLANPSLLPTQLVCRVARQDVTVALSGDGGDELFGGYNRYQRLPRLLGVADRLPAGIRRRVARGIEATALSSRLASAFGPVLRSAGISSQHSVGSRLRRVSSVFGAETSMAAYREFMAVGHVAPPIRWDGGERDDGLSFNRELAGGFASNMMLMDQERYLPDDLLAKVDRASMWTSLEVRVPLLDHRLVEFSWMVPPALKAGASGPKWPLRALASRYVPSEVLDRPKMGFTVPIDSWIRGSLKGWVADTLEPTSIARRGLFEVAAVEGLMREAQRPEGDRGLGIWALAVLEAWCDRNGVSFG